MYDVLVATREISPGVTWFSSCTTLAWVGLPETHVHGSPYLITGTERTLLVDLGTGAHRHLLLEKIPAALGSRKLDYLFPTHPEVPHAGNMLALAEAYPEAVVVGDTRDYELFSPSLSGRFQHFEAGDTIDLGGTIATFVTPAIRDLPNTLWLHDSRSKTLFVSDALGFSHEHEAGQCTMFAEEMPRLPNVKEIAMMNDNPLYTTRFVDMAPYFDRFEGLMKTYDVEVFAPAHGCPMSATIEMLNMIREGVLWGQTSSREALGLKPLVGEPAA